MFQNITVSNFRTFEKATLDDLGKTTAFIGRNAAGKSNLLHALDFFGRLASATESNRYLNGIPITGPSYPAGKPLSFEATVALPEGRYRFSVTATRFRTRPPGSKKITTQLSLTERLDWSDAKSRSEPKLLFSRTKESIVTSEGPTEIRTGHDTPSLVALSSLLPADSPVRRLTEPLRLFLSRVRYYPLDEPARDASSAAVSTGTDYNEWVNEYRRTGVLGEPVPLQILHLSLTMEDRFTELRERLGSKGLRLIDDLTIDEYGDDPGTPHLDPGTGLLDPNTYHAVRFLFRVGGLVKASMRSYAQLSQGTRRLVRLLTAMAYGDSAVMLIEHPEDGIHRGLVKKVTGLFTTGFCPSQTFLSTHSDTVLNGLEPGAIRFVSAEDGKSTVRKMSPAELAAAGEYIDSDAEGTLAEFARSIEG